MRPRYNGLARSYMYWSVLLVAVALALSVLVVLWSTLPVQAQSESTVDDAGETETTGKHLIAFSGDALPQDYAERIADAGGSVETELSRIGVVVADGLTEEAAQSLRSDEDVQAVEQDEKRQWLDPVGEPSVEEIAMEELPAEELPAEETLGEETSAEEGVPASSNEPHKGSFYPRQWNMRVIEADEAWAKNRLGSDEVRVAILDTGIDGGLNEGGNRPERWSHPDLRGPVDLRRGRVVQDQGRVDRSNSASFLEKPEVGAEFPNAPEWSDLHYHGTHVAATVSSNAEILAGTTSKVKLMAVKVLNKNGTGSTSETLKGLDYAVDRGADVINMSLAAQPFQKKMRPGEVAMFNRAFNYAKQKGAVIVVAAGNSERDLNADPNYYQAYCQASHVICVSATGPTSRPPGDEGLNGPWDNIDTPASYTNHGSPIMVAAPGGNGDSNVWSACPSTSVRLQTCRPRVQGNQVLYGVVGLNGTSMAAPHVSGLAALLVEDIGKGKPSEVAARIRKSADDLGDPGTDEFYGAGRINVAKALGLEGRESKGGPRPEKG